MKKPAKRTLEIIGACDDYEESNDDDYHNDFGAYEMMIMFTVNKTLI